MRDSALDLAPSPLFPPCEECGAPLDEQQRYCVNCGARRRDANDPATRYFAAAGRRPARGARAPRTAKSTRNAQILFLALLPVAVGIGVLVGRAGSNNDDQLLDALRHQKGQVLSQGGTATTADAATASASGSGLSSDFGLDKGFTVKVAVLSAKGIDAAAVAAAEKDARSRGATKVGLISPKDFTVKPAQGGKYIVYSGEFKHRAEAEKALRKLSKAFPSAQVLAVRAKSAGGGKVLAHTAYGDVHKVENYHPSAAKVRSDQKVVQRINRQIGKSYIDAQRNLPDVIVVGGAGGGGSSDTGAGQP